MTGASRGLGLEFVRQYASDGASVIACCRAPEKAEQLTALAKTSKHVRILALDVTDPQSLASLVTRLKDEPLDILINNAGIYSGVTGKTQPGVEDRSQEFGSIDGAAFLKVLHANTVSPVLVTEALTPLLEKGKGRKAIIITSKMGSIADMGGSYIAYRTSKAAVNAAARVMALALRPKGIALLNLHPGWVRTDMGGPDAPLSPEQSVRGMRKVIENMSLKQSGQFFAFDGQPIAW